MANPTMNNATAPINNPAISSNDPTQGISTGPVTHLPGTSAANPAAMNPATDPLSELRPLHLPDPVSWWPPAPGWWILSALFLIILLGAIFFLWRHRKNNHYRHAALIELETIKQQFEQQPLQYSQQINRLLKRIALQLWPREKTAHLHGKTWLDFLNTQCKTAIFSQGSIALLADNTYRSELSGDNAAVEQLYQETKHWIGSHRRPKKIYKKAQNHNIVNAEQAS